MPWSETSPMDQKTQFIADVLRGGLPVVELCDDYGISRKTGYKWIDRYLKEGPEGLRDRSRRPAGCPNGTSPELVQAIIDARRRHPSWGAKKLLKILHDKHPRWSWPQRSTVCEILKRNGLVTKKRRRRAIGHPGKPTTIVTAPNDLWCADYKGQFKTGDGRYCYPLTVTDDFSRYLIGCQGLLDTSVDGAKPVFTRLFREFGLPKRIRTDNGVPFASAHALFGLSKLAVWWLRLGIQIERIQPGHPQQNGRHERMHLTLKKEATKPAAQNFLQQQARFDDFTDCYNHERPHQALNMKYPAELYEPSSRPYRGLHELSYPFHDRTITVTQCGRLCMSRQKINLSTVFAGQKLGVKQISDKIWLVTFMDYDLGFFDDETCRLEPIANPFAAKVLPMSPE